MTARQLKQEAGSREKLIEATIELMSVHGFESMGVSAILEKSGVTKSNFYYHFKSKEELSLAALDAMSEVFFKEIIEPVLCDRSVSPDRRLENLFNRMHLKMQESCCNKGCPFVNLAAETSDFRPSFRAKIDAHFAHYQELIADCYREGVERGIFRKELTPEQAANLILSVMNGTVVQAKVQKDPAIIESNIKATMALFTAR